MTFLRLPIAKRNKNQWLTFPNVSLVLISENLKKERKLDISAILKFEVFLSKLELKIVSDDENGLKTFRLRFKV